MPSFLTPILMPLALKAIFGLAGMAATWAMVHAGLLIAKLRANKKTEKLGDELEIVRGFVADMVAHLAQVERPKLAIVAATGKPSPEALAALKQEALAETMNFIKGGALGLLQQMLARAAPALAKLVSGMIEREVLKLSDPAAL